MPGTIIRNVFSNDLNMNLLINITIVLAAFTGIEGMAWLTHKYIMHGIFWPPAQGPSFEEALRFHRAKRSVLPDIRLAGYRLSCESILTQIIS
jgi:hypothetical protein